LLLLLAFLGQVRARVLKSDSGTWALMTLLCLKEKSKFGFIVHRYQFIPRTCDLEMLCELHSPQRQLDTEFNAAKVIILGDIIHYVQFVKELILTQQTDSRDEFIIFPIKMRLFEYFC
jgi:hypothetical protein